jgi:tetratricopeptide (TPR) repeat protein
MTNSALSAKTELVEFPIALKATPPPAVSIEAKQYFEEGLAHLQSGEAEEAVVALSRSIERAPAFPQAHVFLGIAHALTSNIYPAIDHLEEAAKLDPDSFAAHYTLAQLNFKLRIPESGYQSAKQALQCVQTLEQRKMLTQLLKEERERERNGIARPAFPRPFSTRMLLFLGSALAAAIIFAMAHMR